MEDKYLQTKESNGNETFAIAKKSHTSECEETTTEYVEAEQTLDEPNEKLANETRHDIKKVENYIGSMAEQQDQQQHPVLLGKTNAAEVNQYYFHEKMVYKLQSKVLFLMSQLKSKENYFLQEINFLRQQLESASNSVRWRKRFFSLGEIKLICKHKT